MLEMLAIVISAEWIEPMDLVDRIELGYALYFGILIVA